MENEGTGIDVTHKAVWNEYGSFHLKKKKLTHKVLYLFFHVFKNLSC